VGGREVEALATSSTSKPSTATRAETLEATTSAASRSTPARRSLRHLPAQPHHRQLHPVDPATNLTVAAGISSAGASPLSAVAETPMRDQPHLPPEQAQAARSAGAPWGPARRRLADRALGSGKSTIAAAVEHTLVSSGQSAFMLDGDNLRHGLNANLGFSDSDSGRERAPGRRGCADPGRSRTISTVSLVSPSGPTATGQGTAHRGRIPFHEVFVDTPLQECERRDPKGPTRKPGRGRSPT